MLTCSEKIRGIFLKASILNKRHLLSSEVHGGIVRCRIDTDTTTGMAVLTHSQLPSLTIKNDSTNGNVYRLITDKQCPKGLRPMEIVSRISPGTGREQWSLPLAPPLK